MINGDNGLTQYFKAVLNDQIWNIYSVGISMGEGVRNRGLKNGLFTHFDQPMLGS